MPNADKNAIRKQYRQKRQQLSQGEQARAADALCTRIAALTVYQDAQKIALYQAAHHEINLHPLWLLAESAQKICYMPAINNTDNTLIFLPATPNTPQKYNQFQILEPDISPQKAINPDQIDLMIIPLVAFTPDGKRLGQGAGYYDKTLANTRPRCMIGAAYDFQQHPSLPTDTWDILLDGIMTDKHTFWSNT